MPKLDKYWKLYILVETVCRENMGYATWNMSPISRLL
jgi:hypothetical protein